MELGIMWIGAIVITIKKENKGNISVQSEQQSLFIKKDLSSSFPY